MKYVFRLLVILFLWGCEHLGVQEPQNSDEISLNYQSCILLKLDDIGLFENTASQGMTVYQDKYLFQGNNPNDKNNNIYVVDIPMRTVVGVVKYGMDSHLNTISCGRKLSQADVFPVLYISQCFYDRGCDVVRLADDLSYYTSIQYIRYIGTNYMIDFSAADWVVDNNNNKIYHYGTKNEHTQILQFPLPSININYVAFTDKDIEAVYEFYGPMIYQGATIINNRIYIPYGYGSDEYPSYMKVFDFNKRMIVAHIDLNGFGETESVALYKGNLLIVNHSTNPIYTELIF